MFSLLWKINRLRMMSLREIFWRVGRSLQARLEQAGIGGVKRVPDPVGYSGQAWLASMPGDFNQEQYKEAAERILSGRFSVFSMRDVALGFPPCWNRDPETGKDAPLIFGKRLDYRNESLVGNIKYLWEPNRHLELVTLAQAFHLTGSRRYLDGLQVLLDSWFEQCPYPLGPNWTSSLEHSVRLVNWAVAWQLIGGDDASVFEAPEGKAFRVRWLDSIYKHLHFIRKHLSRHSSANNHLLGEYMGLFVGSVTWPVWEECDGWRDLAKGGLEDESLRQNTADGVNREQATWYHHEVIDMLLLCGLVGRANRIEFSTVWWERLSRMMEYIASIMDSGGHVPMFGDSDDAVMVRFSQQKNFDVFRSLLATGAVLFNRADFKIKAQQFDDKSRWLLGDEAAMQFDALPDRHDGLPVSQAFSEGGCYILGDGFETGHEVRIVARAGPLGYLSIAAHGHADALSFTLSAGGKEMLVDSGTYAYHTEKVWRDYFRGTSAHNTLRVNEEDQSVAGGNFLWTQHAHAWCDSFRVSQVRDEWTGCHDGYRRLPVPVLHRRNIVFDKPDRTILVTDELAGTGRHKIEVFWHFAELCSVSLENNEVVARNGESELTIFAPEGFKIELVRGRESPPLGWISRRFGEREPITAVVWTGEIEAGIPVQTRIRVEFCVGKDNK